MKYLLGITGNRVIVSAQPSTATNPQPTEQLNLIVEDDGTLKALTDQQLNERQASDN